MTDCRLGKVGDVLPHVTDEPVDTVALGNDRVVVINATDLTVLAASTRLGRFGPSPGCVQPRAEDLENGEETDPRMILSGRATASGRSPDCLCFQPVRSGGWVRRRDRE